MDFAPHTWILLPLILAVSAVLFRRLRRLASNPPHPPGPPGLPILGNLFDRPKEYPWVTYKQWSQKYGEHQTLVARLRPRLNIVLTIGSNLLRLNMLGKNIVIINSADIATDLLDKRGTLSTLR